MLNVTGSGVVGCKGLHIGYALIEESGAYAVTDSPYLSEVTVGSHARIDRLRIVNPCGSAEAAAVFSGYMERWDIGTLEAIDTRGASAKMTYALEPWRSNVITVESAYISGAKTGSYNQESGTVTQQGVARGVATLSAGKVTVTCVMAGTSSQIHLNTLSAAPVAVGVKERKAGSFVIESSASSSDQVAWAVYPM